MKKTLFFLFLLSGLYAQAQTHIVGLNIGTNSSSISSNAVFGTPSLRLGFHGGLGYEYIFKNKLSLGAEVQYQERGFRQATNFTDQFGALLGISNSDYRINYLSIPVKVGYYVGNRFFGFGNIGLAPSFLLKAQATFPTLNLAGEIIEQEPVDNTSSYSSFDLGGRAEVGGGYKLNKQFWVTGSVAYLHSLTPTKVSGFLNELQLRQFGINVNLGLKYTL